MNDIQISKLKEFYNNNKSEYFRRRASGDTSLWNEKFKWEYFPQLNKEFSKIEYIDISREAEILKELQKTNSKLSMMTWRDSAIFQDHANKNDGMFAKILNYLWFSGDSENDLIEKSNEILAEVDEKPMSPATFAFLLAAKDCGKFAPHKDFIYQGVSSLLGEKSKTRGGKYALVNEAAKTIGELISAEKSGEDYQQKALNGQDFLYLSFAKDYGQTFIGKIRALVEGFLEKNPDFVSKIEPNDDEMSRRLVEFRKRFSLESILKMSDEELLREIPQGNGNSRSMMTLLEHDRGLRDFGTIGIFGSRYMGVYRHNSGQWRNYLDEPFSSEKDVIDFYRWQFEKISEAIKIFEEDDFEKFDELINADKEAKLLFNRQIIKKYICILLPEKFIPIFANSLVKKMDYDDKNMNWYEFSNSLTEIAQEREISNYKFGRVLIEIFSDKDDKKKAGETSENESYSNSLHDNFSKNLILYGPPGTGKTFRIDSIRAELGVKPENFEFITFHQSYSYEDFIEGIRATTQNGAISYEVKSGIFKEICERAMRNPAEKFLLAIDEINRGNISKIFGELITLIEDSKREERKFEAILPYSREKFIVPKNLYIVGTMNTADRSIALLDNALRRRFDFEEMVPDCDLIREKCGFEREKVSKIVEELNVRISVLIGRDYQIGHSYFLEKINSAEALENVWNRQILPLIQEYFYDNWTQISMLLGEKSVEEKEINIGGEKFSKFEFRKMSAEQILNIFEKESE